MSERGTLLQPFFWSIKNRFFPPGQVPYKTMFAALFSLIVCLIIYYFSVKVIGYFHRQSELGIILSLKIFQMAWITLFAMLVFSCMVSAVSTLFLSQDNEIIYASSAPARDIFFMRYVTTSVYTSWMMIVFSLPVFAAYGQVFRADILYLLLLAVTLTATAAVATAFGLLLTILLVNIFPARRTKDIILYLTVCFGIFIYIMFRLMRPEDLVNPDKYLQFVDYLSSISKPAAPYIPASWAANFLSLYLLERQFDWLLGSLIIISPLVLFFLGEWAMEFLFFSGYTKSQESFGGYRRFAVRTRYRAGSWRWCFRKEAKTFIRDSAEWSQLFMIAALVVVYLYNFKSLPVDRSFFEEEYVTNLISFLNIGLSGFIITSLSARFVYPSVGAEGGAFYHIHSAPISVSRYLLYKYLFYAIPFTGLALLLVIASDHLLNITGPMWWFSVITTTVISWTVVAIALGFGAKYADFKAESRAAALGSMGAILFLFTAMTFQLVIIFFGALPAYRLVRKWLKGLPLQTIDITILLIWIIASLLLAAGVALYYFRKGVNTLENFI